MSIRGSIGTGVRRVIGKNLYTRLRIGMRAENSFLSRARGVIHVGAHAGQERDLYAAFGLSVIWIEPIPEVFELLKSNISHYARQQAYRYLVTDEDGAEYTLNIADNDGASSSILEFSKHTEMYPHIAYKATINLRGTTLDSIVSTEQVDVGCYDTLVLDTQGSELRILRGAVAVLPNFKFVKVEVPDFESYKGCCQTADLSAFMFSNGFSQRSRCPIKHTAGVGTYFDIIYERRPR